MSVDTVRTVRFLAVRAVRFLAVVFWLSFFGCRFLAWQAFRVGI